MRFSSSPVALSLAVALVVLPAGALFVAQDAAEDAAAAPAAPPTSPTFGAPTRVVNAYGFEPSVRVDSQGQIYVALARGLVIGGFTSSWIFKSTDGGATWTKLPTPLGAGFAGAEPSIAIGDDDTLYWSDLYLGNIYVGWYTPDGQVGGWHIVGEASAVMDRQWITVGKKSPTGGHEMWINTNDGPGRGVNQYYSPDAKLTPAVLRSNIVLGSHLSVPPKYDPVRDTVYQVYSTSGGALAARTSTTQALPTRTVISSEDADITYTFPVVAIDKGGNAYATWVTERDGRMFLRLAWTTDGLNWNGPVDVTDGTGSAAFPWIAANEPGRVAIAYLGSDEPGHPHNVEGAWQVRVAQTIDVLSGAPTFAHAKATGTIHEGGVCVEGLSCDLGAGIDRDLGDYIQIAIDPTDGMMHVAYTDDFTQAGQRIFHVKQASGTPT